MEKIDLKDWSLLSERVASKNYISPDFKWLLKYYHTLDEGEMSVIKREQEVSRAVLAMGIPTPKAGDIVEIDGGYGVLFENITHKVSISRGISQDFSRMPELIEMFCDLGKILHSTPCDTNTFPSMEEVLISFVKKADTVYTKEEQVKIINFIEKTPKAATCLHGDFHPGNFITGDQGSFVIDLGDFSYGNEIYDWAQWWFMSHAVPDPAITKVFHMSKEDIIKCWEKSLEITFNIRGRELEQKEEEIAEYGKFVPVKFIGLMPTAEQDLFKLKNTIKFLNA